MLGRWWSADQRVEAVLPGVAPLAKPARRLLVLSLGLAVASGCSAQSRATHDDSEDAIYGGAVDSDGLANAAVVALRVGQPNEGELCSATAIASNVLLTARHCVSKSITDIVVCDSLGHSQNGDHFGDDQPISDIRVFTGSQPNFSGPSAALVKRIFHPDEPIVCNRDIAVLVLDRDLDNVTPMPVRMARAVGVEELIRSVGYGKTDTGVTGTRLRRAGVAVRAVGPGLSSSDTALGDHEFEVGLSICHGDSGGPAISQTTGAVVGVVSRGGDCSEDFGHIYVETSGFSDLIQRAIDASGATPPPEEPPAPATPTTTATSKNGCAVGAPPGGKFEGWSMAFLAMLVGLTLRRARRSAPSPSSR